MNCTNLWSCVSLQLPSVVTLWYQSLAPYLALLVALFLVFYTIWYFTTTTVNPSPRAGEARFWVYLVFLIGILLLIPPAIFLWQPSWLLSLLGAPENVDVFQIGPEVSSALAWLVSASTFASWAGLLLLLGAVVWPVAYLGQSLKPAAESPTITDTPTPWEKQIKGDQLGEITPIRTTSSSSNPNEELTRPAGMVMESTISRSMTSPMAGARKSTDPEKTAVPMSGGGSGASVSAETLPVFAWLELRWVGSQPYQGYQRWTQLPGRKATIGRRAADTKNLLDLPGADNSISRNQVVIEPSNTGFMLSNKGSASVRVDNRLISANQTEELRNGAQITIGAGEHTYEFLYHVLPKPILQIIDEDRAPTPIRIDGYRYAIGGSASGITLGLQQPAATIYVDTTSQQPQFVIRAESNVPLRILVGDREVKQEPVPLKPNDYIIVGDHCKLMFQLPA